MNNDTKKHQEDKKSIRVHDKNNDRTSEKRSDTHDTDIKKDTNPFYSFVNNEGTPFLFGLSKVRFFSLCIIVIILILGTVGVSFFRNEMREQRNEQAQQWFVDIGETLCKNQNNDGSSPYSPDEMEEACFEGLLALQNYMDAFQKSVEEIGSKGSDLSEEELSNVFFNVFITEKINNRVSANEHAAFMKKCYEHPEINTDTAALLCSLLFFPG